MEHQSGIPDFTNSFNYRNTTARLLFEKDDFIQRFCNGDLTLTLENFTATENTGYVILGRIIEKVTNRSDEQNVFDRITQPLGMTNTGYNNPPKTCGIVYPNGEIQKGE